MTRICREIPATGVEYAVLSFEVSSSLQVLQPLRAMRAMPALRTMHAMRPGRGECNDATTSAKVMDRVVQSHWELVPRTHLSLVRRCSQ